MKQAGYVAIVGRPNVGKSTLINQILGQKIAITSRKPQTTRHALLGIFTQADVQMVFVDTPGIHQENKKAINRQMNRTAWQAFDYVDVIVQVSEVGKWCEDDERIAKALSEQNIPSIHVVNKIDKLHDKAQLLTLLPEIEGKNNWQAIVPLSASRRENLESLIKTLTPFMLEQEWIYPEDQITTAGMRFMAAELIREKIFRYLHQEIPYGIGVIIERYREEENLVHIDATIMLEKDSYKGIVIGKRGRTLQAIGKAAREELERLLEKKVMLKNFVKIKENWRDNEQILRSMQMGSGIEVE